MSSDELIEQLKLFGAEGTVSNPVALIREAVVELTRLRNDVKFYREWSNELAMNIPEEHDNDVAQEAIISKWAKDMAAGPPIKPPVVFGLYETVDIGTRSSLRAVTFSQLTAEQWVAENDPQKTWETRSFRELSVWTGREAKP